MPRLPRIYLEGAVYYVTSAGSQNQELFKDKADYQMYLGLLTKYKEQHPFKLFSYCLLPDRLYLLIETGEGATISEIMHNLNSLYTKYYNSRYQKHGHLCESRFRSVLVEKTPHLLEMTSFIHQSPKRHADIVQRFTLPAGFREYPYSSYSLYMAMEGSRSVEADPFEEIREVLNLLETKSGRGSYESYCQGSGGEMKELETRLRRGSILGSEDFEIRVKNRLAEYSKERKEKPFVQIWSGKNKLVVVLIGLGVLVTTSSAVYLYIARQSLANKYATLLKVNEEEFKTKLRFENQNPLSLSELDGTEWEIQLVPLPVSDAKQPFKDKIRFDGGFFSSAYFKSLGFRNASYFLVPQGNRVVQWQSAQSNPQADSVGWQGEWHGSLMRGRITLTLMGEKPQEFSFFSVKWSYAEGSR